MGYNPRFRYQRRVETPAAAVAASPVMEPPRPTEAPAVERLRDTNRDLWNDYVWRTRNFLLAKNSSSTELAMAETWVVQNIDDITNQFFIYYGPDASNMLRSSLLAWHTALVGVMDYLRTVPTNFDPSADRWLGEKLLTWRDRTQALTTAFTSMNPVRWNNIDVGNILDNIREFWYNQLLARRSEEWVRDLSYLDRSFDEAVKLAALITEGILEQQSSRFS